MCGVLGFLSNREWSTVADLSGLQAIAADLREARTAADRWARVAAALDRLESSFSQLMSFAVHRAVATDETLRETFVVLAEDLSELRAEASEQPSLQQRLADYHWQVRVEVLDQIDAVQRLLPGPIASCDAGRHFVAWAIERVLEGIDKLEVRGRDSAGVAILLDLAGDDPVDSGLDADLRAELAVRLDAGEASDSLLAVGQREDGRPTLRVMHKVANLVGRLGDNGTALRNAIANDGVLWALAPRVQAVNILSHTRWASNGIINIANCHPVDGRHTQNDTSLGLPDSVFVLNGDVDNYEALMSSVVHSRSLSVHPAVSTDAKILPLLFDLDTDESDDTAARFARVMRRGQGSLAVAMQRLDAPDVLLVGQKGSGQALYLGTCRDGWLVASEVYGLATLCRSQRSLNTGGEAGVSVELRFDGDAASLAGKTLDSSEAWAPEVEEIEIFPRDIFRAGHSTYIEKETNEAPSVVRKTLAGKYAIEGESVRFLPEGFLHGDMLRARLTSTDPKPIRRIFVIGQGTAAIAAMGAAHLMRQALKDRDITVTASTASELFGFTVESRLDDAIVVAISQSGTTTDTNRVVDIARSRGAWIQAIVNRRNSALVHKSDSVLYTGDGRDVEMSVASTKAFYAQVAAGNLLGLLLGVELGTLSPDEVHAAITRLEKLPEKIAETLARSEAIAEVAGHYAPRARNWALVGNGANRIAAEEIRIKLSELCYKAIPCDVTEDKKHIDLSTEPLTLVIANDLPEMVVQDTVKEASIFKAHNGRPLVFCADGENRFDGIAERTIPLPTIGGGLDFVIATVAGHLFGIAAARAIDESAEPFRAVRGVLSKVSDEPAAFRRSELSDALHRALDSVQEGHADSALPASIVARLGRYIAWLDRQPDAVTADAAGLDELRETLNRVIDDLTRPIDTIRHQAKTVTVGISRPEQELSPLFEEVLTELETSSSGLAERDDELLRILSPLLVGIGGAVYYDVAFQDEWPSGRTWTLQAVRAFGESHITDSKYTTPGVATGTKHRALRRDAAVVAIGRDGDERLLVVPVHASAGVVSGLILFHVELAEKASLQQKASLLRSLGEKWDDLAEEIAERLPDVSRDEVVGQTSPDALVFEPVHVIVDAFAATSRVQ